MPEALKPGLHITRGPAVQEGDQSAHAKVHD
jgi:hypothetical protein